MEITHAQQQVTCLKGRLRDTLGHMLADDIVERGEHYLAASGSHMLVHALGDARMVVSTLRA